MESKVDWELCKENIKPLKQGRNMANLQPAIQDDMATDKNYTERLNYEKTQFEAKIRTYEGDDSFGPWYCYMSWIEQNDPKGGKTKSLKKIMYESILKFKDEDQYKNDSRFIEICLKFALMAKEPIEVYHYMYSEKLGLKLALYFKSWANYLVSVGNLKDADSVITEGLSKNAQPKDELLLEQAHINKIAAQGKAERQSNEETEFQRTALSNLRQCGTKQKIGPTRTGLAKQNLKNVQKCDTGNLKVPTTQSSFVPYQDENKKKPSKEFVKTNGNMIVEGNQENEIKPSKWTQVKVPAKVVQPPQTKFEVLIDPVASQITKKVTIEKTGLSVSKAAIDNDKFTLSTKKPADLKEVHKFCKDKLFCGDSEFQFEELRALRWIKANQNKKQTCKSDINQRTQKTENIQTADNFKGKSSETDLPIIKLSDQVTKVKILEKDESLIQHGFQRPSKSRRVLSENCGFINGHKLDLQSEPIKDVIQKGGNSTMSDMWNAPFQDPISEFIKEEAHLINNSAPEINHNLKSGFVVFHDEEPSVLPTQIVENRVDRFAKPIASFEISRDYEGPVKIGSSNKVFQSRTLHECEHFQKPKPNFTVFSDEVDAPKLSSSKQIIYKLDAKEFSDGIPKAEINFTVFRDDLDVFNLGVSSNQAMPKLDVNEYSDNIPKVNANFTVYREELVASNQGASNQTMPKLNVNEYGDKIPNVDTNFDVCRDVESPGRENINYSPVQDFERFLPREILVPLNDLPTIRLDEIENYIDVDRVKTAEVSMAYISNTAFLRNLNVASTPTKVNNFTKDNVKKPLMSIVDENKPLSINFENEGNAANQSPNFYRRSFRGTNHPGLSPISETSREYKSSSSSSSSTGTALSAVQRSRFHGTKSREEISTFSEKTTGCRSLNYCITNPFDEALINDMLNNLPIPLNQIPGYEFNPSSIPPIPADYVIHLGNDAYKIIGECGHGAFASVFYAIQFGVDKETSYEIRKNLLALKFQSVPCPWEFYIAKQLNSRISQSTTSFDVLPSIVDISKFYCYNNGSVAVTKFYGFGTLLNVVNCYKEKRQCMPECLVMYLAIEMLEIIHQVHESGIIHADVKPDNFLLIDLPQMESYCSDSTFEKIFKNCTQSIKLIDYGRSIDLRLFDPNVVFKHAVETSGFVCPTMLDDKPWTFQPDYYGIAGSIHVMLFGEYLKIKKSETKWIWTCKLKRYWNTQVWETILNNLINIPDCDTQPNIPSMISMLKDALVSQKMIRDMLQKRNELYNMLKDRFRI